MFSFQGALAGLATGLTFCSWLGFGGPKPPLKKLPSSIEGCPNISQTSTLSSIINAFADDNFIDEDATTIMYTEVSR